MGLRKKKSNSRELKFKLKKKLSLKRHYSLYSNTKSSSHGRTRARPWQTHKGLSINDVNKYFVSFEPFLFPCHEFMYSFFIDMRYQFFVDVWTPTPFVKGCRDLWMTPLIVIEWPPVAYRKYVLHTWWKIPFKNWILKRLKNT